MNIYFEEQIDALIKHTWRFWVTENTLILSNFSIMKKESSRHKFKVIKYYDRIMKRDSSISVNEIPFTDEIRLKAIKLFTDQITCKI